MCVIALCEKRKLTPLEIYFCWANNPDGAGISFMENDNHVFVKGIMTYRDFFHMYEYMDMFPHAVHFRIACSGGINPYMTHPYICEENSPLTLSWEGKSPVLFHNGVISLPHRREPGWTSTPGGGRGQVFEPGR